MKDRWMNVGHEDDELKPYVEPLPDYKDPRRTGAALGQGYLPCSTDPWISAGLINTGLISVVCPKTL